MENEEKIVEGLKKIRKAKHLTLLLFFGFIPTSILLISFDFSFPLSIIPYGILFLLVGAYTGLQKCPKCGELFFWNMNKNIIGYRNPFTNNCLNCGQHIKMCNKIST